MSFLSAMNSFGGRFKTGVFSGAGRGGPGRLLVIAGVGVGMAALLVVVAMTSQKPNIESRVAKMKAMNLLPGGLQSTPAQDALLVRHSQAEAAKAEAKSEGFTPPMPGSVPLKSPVPKEIGVDPQQPVKVADLVVHIVPVPPPAYVAPERPPAPSPLIEKVSSSDAVEMDPETRRAVNDLFNGWDVRAPRTDIVLTPAVARSLEGNGRSDVETTSGTAAAPLVAVSPPRTVLVPAGRGVYAHTIVSVNSDTGGPIILEADTGPLAGDRFLGTFAKSQGDRLIVRVTTVEHGGKSLEVAGIVVSPDTMETSVASAIDEHYAERFILPAAAAFVSGLGQALAYSNATTTVSPFGGTSTQYGQLNFKQQLGVGAGAAGANVGQTLQQSVPKGPTIILGANVGVAVMFLADVFAPK
jgi:intracellular multiplication protein IcmE